MTSRRALIVAPLYDGEWLPPLPGRTFLVERLTKCLETFGQYEVKALNGLVEEDALRGELARFFDTDGELLFYFYGHGCLRPPGLGVFAISSARPNKEGLLMTEVTAFANYSAAREVVIILDCCHAGAAIPASDDLIRDATGQMPAGRGLLAACASHQQGWTATTKDQKQLGVFSSYVLSGLEGEACPRGDSKVRTGILGSYVTEKFRSWGQSPFFQTHETGDRFCVLTSDLPEIAQAHVSQIQSTTLALGVPFKPSQLFIGRSAELDYLRSMLIDGTKPVAMSASVEGLGGIGKTELVLQLLQDPEILAVYNTIAWLDGAGPLPPQWAKIAEELEIRRKPKLPEQLVKKVSAAFRKRGNTLIVLDNASEWSPLSKFIPLEFPLLVTTRARDFGGGSFRHTELGFLPPDSARDLLLGMVSELANDSGLDQLVEILDGHALAIELAGWNIKYLGISASEYIERIKKNKKDSSQALAAIKQGKTVEACLSLTWDSLHLDASRRLWRNASLFAPTSAHRDLLRVSFSGNEEIRRELTYLRRREPGEFAFPNPEEFDDAYAELRACHVLSRVEGFNGERWAMHRLVRDYGRARLQSDEIMMHAMAISEWLREPTLPLAPEIPHFVVAVLDSARHVGELEGSRGRRYFSGEISHRSGFSFNSRYFIDFLKTELHDPQALTLILSGLRDVNEDVRIQAIRLLETVGPIPEVLDGLAMSLSDPEATVRERAATTLAQHGGRKTLEILTAAVRSPNAPSRLSAVRALGIMGSKAKKALLIALKSSDAIVRYNAGIFLCEQGAKQGISEVVERLRGELALGASEHAATETVRAVDALSNVNGSAVETLLFELLRSADDSVKTASAKAITKLKISGGSDAIVSELAQQSLKSLERLRGFTPVALEAAASSKIPLPMPLARSLLKKADTSLVAACAKALGEARVKAALPLLIDLLPVTDSGAHGISRATTDIIHALATIGHSRASAPLLALAKRCNDPGIKAASIQALIDIGEIDTLIQLLGRDTSTTRKKAAETIGILRVQQAVPALATALKDNDSRDTRLAFVKALFLIGDDPALDALSFVVKTESDDAVRCAAMAAVINIRSNSIWKKESMMFTIFEVGLKTPKIRLREAASALLIWLNHTHDNKQQKCEDCNVRNLILPKRKLSNEGLEFAKYIAIQRLQDANDEEQYETLQKLLVNVQLLLGRADLQMFLDSFSKTTSSHESYTAYVKVLLTLLSSYEFSISLDSLSKLLLNGDSLTQQSATMAMAILRKSKAISALIAATDSHKAATRWGAIAALEAIGGKRAKVHLTLIARASTNDVERDAAKKALRRLSGRRNRRIA